MLRQFAPTQRPETRRVAGLILLLFSTTAMADEPAEVRKSEPQYSAICSQAEQEILQALLRRAPFEGEHGRQYDGVYDDYFGLIIEDLTAALGVPIVVDLLALEEHGIAKDTVVQLNAGGLTVRSAFDLLLRPLDLDWDIDGEVLWISSHQKIRERRHVRLYDVSRLISDGSSDGLSDPEELLNLIKNHIEPVSWADVGGAGQVDFVDFGHARVLVVSQMRAVHEQVATLLDFLERVQSAPTSATDTTPQPAPSSGSMPQGAISAELVAAQNDFALRILRFASEDAAGDNLVLGAHGAALCLAMAHSGATGEAERELAAALYGSANASCQPRDWEHLRAAVLNDASQRGFVLRCGNRAWLENRLSPRAEFVANMRDHFGAGFDTFDLGRGLNRLARDINAWVEQLTDGRLTDIVAPGDLPDDAGLLLANAMLLQADWKQPFSPVRTRPAVFHAPDGQLDVSMMGDNEMFVMHLRNDRLQMIELPYTNKNFAMQFILPATTDGSLEELQASLSAAELRECSERLALKRAAVYIPRFEFERTQSLEHALRAMGVQAAFELSDTNFANITTDAPLYIADVLHRALIRVDEQGTEAAAVTLGMFGLGAEPESDPHYTFRADRPFLFTIVHRRSGAILFIGCCMKPPAVLADDTTAAETNANDRTPSPAAGD